MSESGFNTFGFVASILSVAALLGPVFGVIYFYLPSRRQKYLDELLCETERMWRTAVEEGLFVGQSFATFLESTELALARYDLISTLRGRVITAFCRGFHSQANNLRMQTHCATTVYRQVKGTVDGLSLKIVYLYGEVTELRATISTTTTEERKRLQREGRYMPTMSRTIARPTGVAAHPRNLVDEAVHSSIDSLSHTDGSDYSANPEYLPEAPAEEGFAISHISSKPTAPISDSSTLADSDSEDAELRHALSATVNVEEAPVQTLKKDLGAIGPPLCSHLLGVAPQQHPFPTDSALYQILHRVHRDLSSKGQSHPLLSAAAEYAHQTVDLEPLLRQYEGDVSTLPSENSEMQMIEDCV
ncbi:predicted protein [Sparassis crispa]|uniref:Uncharacterized protein n=1 Tax=Sparassis crispa TaxID=139825 RepID=A0A401GT75_9APHY|nr:predicted protein [Sparassis crispa]GBE85441.1 predicted protein [Sparassis crispa]